MKSSEFESLDLSQNSKVAFHKKHLNTFGVMYGLPSSGGTCTFATVGKGGCLEKRKGVQHTCYMDNVARRQKQVVPVLQRNTDLLKGKNFHELVNIFNNTVMKFLLLNKGKDQYFRLYYSGDVENETIAKAWVHVIKVWPMCRFWMYTRSYPFAHILVQAKNLALYLSCDPNNYENAKCVYETLKHHPNISLAWMGNEAPSEYKFIPCPDINKKLKSKENPCGNCRLCFTYKDNIPLRKIQFPIH